ncbi:hypothetical protein [Streptomyces sp. 5-10]|uniref:hypothetical protein n=1 Tax=Streptomyces sp. 5-10 TaxID=878925 RepID=UPI0034DB602B
MNRNCPGCGSSLTYIKGENRINRAIAVEVVGVHAGTLFYRCPDCGHEWHAWADPNVQAKALPYMRKTEKKPHGRPDVSPSQPVWHIF